MDHGAGAQKETGLEERVGDEMEDARGVAFQQQPRCETGRAEP